MRTRTKYAVTRFEDEAVVRPLRRSSSERLRRPVGSVDSSVMNRGLWIGRKGSIACRSAQQVEGHFQLRISLQNEAEAHCS